MPTNNFVYEFEIPSAWAGRKLKSILQSEMKMSTRLLRSMAPYESVTKNGVLAYLNQPVVEGDKINIMLPTESSDVVAEAMDLDIRYEDSEVIVVNKLPGVLTHPTAREREGSLLAGIAAYLKPQGAVPHSVHRLDRDTSGVVMFAKHAHIHHLFDIALRNGAMHREYCCIVSHRDTFAPMRVGDWETIDLPIGIDPNRPSKRVITAAGQRAITHYKVVAQTKDLSLVVIRLETGRTHQIRLHFSAMGMPLIGDPVYGNRYGSSTADYGGMTRQALHAARLTFTHPVTRVERTVTAPVATDLRHLWAEAGGEETIFAAVDSGQAWDNETRNERGPNA